MTLRKNDKFYKNITMEQVMQIYNFDAELRAALLYLLEYIKTSICREYYSPILYNYIENWLQGFVVLRNITGLALEKSRFFVFLFKISI